MVKWLSDGKKKTCPYLHQKNIGTHIRALINLKAHKIKQYAELCAPKKKHSYLGALNAKRAKKEHFFPFLCYIICS